MDGKPSRATFRERLDSMINQLREEIITGKIEAGKYLPSEDDLGSQFQLSKNSVRKGLEVLVDENLITKKPRIGNMVNELAAKSEKMVIRFSYYPNSDVEQNILFLIDEFEKKYPHIQVKRVMLHVQEANEFDRNMFDVVMLNYNNFRRLQKNDLLEGFALQTPDPGVYSFLNRAFRVGDQLFAKPFVFSPVILCYNKEHFAAKGMAEPDSSWTWDEFCDAVKQLSGTTASEQTRLGFYFHLLSMNRWPLFFLQNNFQLQVDEQGKVAFDHEAAMKSMAMIKSLFSQQKIISSFASESDLDTERLFLEEKASMIVTTYFSLNHLKAAPFEYDISPVPFIHYPQTLLLNIGLAVNKQAEYLQAAQLLVDFLTSKEAQLLVRQHTLSIPALKSAAEAEDNKLKFEPTRFQMFKEIIPSFRYYTDMHLETEHLNAMRYYLKLFMSGIDDSLPNVVNSIERELKV